MTGDKSNRTPSLLASRTVNALEMGIWLMCEFRDPDRIFDAIIYTSRSDNIMRYSDEVRVSMAYLSVVFFISMIFVVVRATDAHNTGFDRERSRNCANGP